MKKLIILLILLVPALAIGATYYVDFDSGANTNNGTTTGTAFKHCPGDLVATDTALSTTLSPGDTVIFKGGVEYKGSILIGSSGSSGNIITYDGNSAGTWGTGKAVINGENIGGDARRYAIRATSNRSYITIKNFDIQHMGGGQTPVSCDPALQTTKSGYGISFEGGGSNIIVKDCDIWDIGDWLYQEYASALYQIGAGVRFIGSYSVVVVDNIDLTKNAQYCIEFLTSGAGAIITDIEVKNCTIHGDIRWGIYFGLGASGSRMDDLKIHDNTLADIFHTPPTWPGCPGQYPHIDPMMFTVNSYPSSSTLGTPEKPVRIYNNISYYDSTYGSSSGEYFLTAWGGTTYLYNNVFIYSRTTGASLYFQGMNNYDKADFHIYNNTFYNTKKSVWTRYTSPGLWSTAENVRVKNNIFYHMTSSSALPPFGTYSELAESGYTAINNNVFYTVNASNYVFGVYEAGVYKAKTVDWLNALDIGDSNVLAEADSVFLDISYGLGSYSSLNNLRLKPGSPAIGAGEDLSAYFTTDILGKTRTSWDAGAYEYSDTVVLSGTLVGDLALTESDIVLGGRNIIGTVYNTTLVATFGADNQITTDFIAGIVGSGEEAGGWNETMAITHANITRDSDTQFTITLPATPTYNITAAETVSITIPASSTAADQVINASPSIRIDFEIPRDNTKVSITRGNDKAKAGKLGGPKAAELQGN